MSAAFRWPSAAELATRALAAERDAYDAELDVGREPEADGDDDGAAFA